MCKCEACNVRKRVLIRTVNQIWSTENQIRTISSHVLIGEVSSTALSNYRSDQAQTGHRLLRNRHWRTDCNCIVSEPTKWPPSLRHCAQSWNRQRRRRHIRPTPIGAEVDNESLTPFISHITSPHNSNISTVTNRLLTFSSPTHLSTSRCLCRSSMASGVTGDTDADRIVFWLDDGCYQSGASMMRFAWHHCYWCRRVVVEFGKQKIFNVFLFATCSSHNI